MESTQKNASSIRLPSDFNHIPTRLNYALSSGLKQSNAHVRQLMEEIEVLRNLNRQLMDGIHSCVLVLDINGRITAYNSVVHKLTRKRVLDGRSPYEIMPELCQDQVKAALSSALNTGKASQIEEIVFKAKNGDELIVDVRVEPYTDQAGRIKGAFLFIDDVSGHRMLGRKLLASEKPRLIGRLSANLAHELGNPLDGILRYLRMLLDQMPEGDPGRKYAEHARDGVMRVSNMVSGLLDFARRSSSLLAFTPTDIPESISEILAFFSSQITAQNIKLETHFDDNIPVILNADVEQIFMNVIKNAVQAMSDGGTLSVEARMASPDLLEIRFCDTGPGIPEEILESVFEPFFTTKGFDRGVGLGLSISREIAENYGGSIELQSKLGEGTTSIVRLPIGEDGLIACHIESYINSAD